jgi:lysophospholipase L1-like esterase
VDTERGYVDDIYSAELASTPALQLVKLGCPGETTGTFLHGGICPTYGSQMGAADKFLKTYGSQTSFITLDIGANNVDNCAPGGNVNTTCVAQGEKAAGKQLPVILANLEAADPGVVIYAMNYYDPFLAAYLEGPPDGMGLAEASIPLTVDFNNELDQIYTAHGVTVVNVQDNVFDTTDYTMANGDTIGGSPVPDDVYDLCAQTYNCTPSPQGPNIHPNDVGYQNIADAFLADLNPATAG